MWIKGVIYKWNLNLKHTIRSVVSPGAKFEFETDTMDMDSEGATSNARYGLVAIGNFTKIAEVVPIRNKTPEAMIDGLKKIFTSMENQNSYILMKNILWGLQKVNRFLNEDEIKSVQTTTHAHTVERFIKTSQDNLYRRLDSLKEDKNQMDDT